jgi:hypothetical protein
MEGIPAGQICSDSPIYRQTIFHDSGCSWFFQKTRLHTTQEELLSEHGGHIRLAKL